MKPEQPAARSKAAASRALRLSWMMQAVAGIGMSGVTVAQMIRSRSPPWMSAALSASSAALVAKSDIGSSWAATRRSRMPVRVVIHSSEVSTILSRSALVRIRLGRAEPVPRITARRVTSISHLQRGLARKGDPRPSGCHLEDFIVDPVVDPVAHEIQRHADGVLDGPSRRPTVADDRRRPDSEEGHAPILSVIHLLAEVSKGGPRQDVPHLCEKGF